ncbi:S1C family serine protease [Streptomyces sp. 6N223]|uniref:S1C family serine protease n=1 Tax=Streptomyces sp. 6N223 TaxID=3457412 RepID=UPI003FCF4E61
MSTEYEGGRRPAEPDRPDGGDVSARPGRGPEAGHAAPPPGAAPPPPQPPPPPSPPAAAPPPPPATGAWGVPPSPPPPVPPPSSAGTGRGGVVAAVVAATLIAGGIGGGVGYALSDEDDSTQATASTDADGDGNDALARPPESVAGIAEEALPSVVTIETMSGGTATGNGTGFVYDEQGHILTNNHVVAEADAGAALNVIFSDGESYEAEVVGRAEGYDVAVIRLSDVSGRDLEPLELGDSDDVVVGDATVAIGAPFGLDGTVTTGIISALDRPVSTSDATGTDFSYMNALQTDASINPGNSGGPLLNAGGEVIGINSAIQPTSDTGQSGSVGLGFAIPINQAERVAQDLIDTGEPVYPIMGAYVNTDPAVGGAVISEPTAEVPEPITPGGPADQAGLESGDVITRFGDRVIDSGPTLISEIWTYQPGDRVELTYERDGEEHTAQVTLSERIGDEE